MRALFVKFLEQVHARLTQSAHEATGSGQIGGGRVLDTAGLPPGKWVALYQIKDLIEKGTLGHVFKVVEELAKTSDALIAEKKLEENQIYQKLASSSPP